jgi:C_GCAxxG_C_C family probable redox protein
MKITERYQGLSKSQLLEKAFDLGISYERHSGSCSQCTVAALQEIVGFDKILVKAATSSCGGHAGLATSACGGVIGGTMVLDYFFGRDPDLVSNEKSTPYAFGELERAMEIARLLCGKFAGEYGSVLCPQIHKAIFGRSFNLQDPNDWQAFIDAGAHDDASKCMSVVGNAAKWTLEILIDEGVIEI